VHPDQQQAGGDRHQYGAHEYDQHLEPPYLRMRRLNQISDEFERAARSPCLWLDARGIIVVQTLQNDYAGKSFVRMMIPE
jgi:hypothetical protein